VLDANEVADLTSYEEWLWSNPSPLRVGYAESEVGLFVRNFNSRDTLKGVTVEFRLDSADGDLLGRNTIPLLGAFARQSSQPVLWEPALEGTQTICAIIDPDNEVSETDEQNNVICRDVFVATAPSDIYPPEVDSFVMADGVEFSEVPTVTLDVTATDYPIAGGSGPQAIKFIEFEYQLGAREWVPKKQSEWIDYTTAQENFPWTLQPIYGTRYMQAWAIDNAGNRSQAPLTGTISLLPSTQADFVAQHGVAFYRIYLEQGQSLAATLTPVTGDPDLYVWMPDGALEYSNSYTGVEVVEFEAPISGTYQIEVRGFGDTDYNLSFGSTNGTSSGSWGSKNERNEKRGPKPVPTGPIVSLDDSPEYNPDPPAVTATATPMPTATPTPNEPNDHSIYLPIIIR